METMCVCALLTGWLATSATAQEKAVIRSAKSGPWSNPQTWVDGQVPGSGARVLVRQGHQIVYDVQSDQVIRAINVAGTLSFARDRNTRLDVGLIKIQPGEDTSEEGFDCEAHIGEPVPGKARPALEVGSPNHPVDAKYTPSFACITSRAWTRNPARPSSAAAGGMDFHGAPLSRTWVKLGETAKKGDKPSRWRRPSPAGTSATAHRHRHAQNPGDTPAQRGDVTRRNAPSRPSTAPK